MKKMVLMVLVAFILPITAFAATYEIDASHTKVGFKVRHLGISYVPGGFSTVQGTFDFDPKSIKASKTQVKIGATSISTDNQKRDDHLRSADFFDVAKFTDITFVSKEITDINGSNFNVKGDLTIHGVTKPVTLAVEHGGEVTDPWGNERSAFSATTQINRKDFGLSYNKLLETGGLVVGDEVKISIDVEGIKKK